MATTSIGQAFSASKSGSIITSDMSVGIYDDLVKLLNLISVLVTKDKLGQKYLRQVVSVDYRLEHGRHSQDWTKMLRTVQL